MICSRCAVLSIVAVLRSVFGRASGVIPFMVCAPLPWILFTFRVGRQASTGLAEATIIGSFCRRQESVRGARVLFPLVERQHFHDAGGLSPAALMGFAKPLRNAFVEQQT